ncbi:MAG: alanine racemase [Candidatus Komeilibacteria bacterium]|nr:alanine racemase [Candidatus Komeilibacteria bacterium]
MKTYLVKKGDFRKYQKTILKILKAKVEVTPANFKLLVNRFFKKRAAILKMAKAQPTPFYLIDQAELSSALNNFKSAFTKYLPGSKYFYAVKVNHHPYILKQAVKDGYGLDVSSSRELKLALAAGAKGIIFSGPGKTSADLDLALKNRNKIIVNLDSFSELKRLGDLAKKKNQIIAAGVRIYTKYHGEWNKFGIALVDLKKFFNEAKKYPQVKLQGIQFHLSLNAGPAPYVQVIGELSRYLRASFSPRELASLKFIDFGGGFMVPGAEGHYPHESAAGTLIKTTAEYLGEAPKFIDNYYLRPAAPVAEYAKVIGSACKKYLDPLLNVVYFAEPGRIIANNAMHIVLRVVDVKSQNKVIVDGGINLVGWEHFDTDYIPLLNLTHPSLKEKDCLVYGSLCLPEDLWGRWCYVKKMSEGDFLLVPYQGAMTYALAQEFIKGIAPVYILE